MYNKFLSGQCGVTLRIGGLATYYQIDSDLLCPPTPAWVKFSSAGTNTPAVGEQVTGLTSAATAFIKGIVLGTGTYAGGTGNGLLFLGGISGTFQAENLDHTNGATDDLTIAAAPTTAYWMYGKAPRSALLVCSGANINVTLDGTTVTATGGVNDGFLMVPGQTYLVQDHKTVQNLRWIDAAGGTTSVMTVSLFW